jgi:hypothetical protein
MFGVGVMDPEQRQLYVNRIMEGFRGPVSLLIWIDVVATKLVQLEMILN